jgi:hypothetical protein
MLNASVKVLSPSGDCPLLSAGRARYAAEPFNQIPESGVPESTGMSLKTDQMR